MNWRQNDSEDVISIPCRTILFTQCRDTCWFYGERARVLLMGKKDWVERSNSLHQSWALVTESVPWLEVFPIISQPVCIFPLQATYSVSIWPRSGHYWCNWSFNNTECCHWNIPGVHHHQRQDISSIHNLTRNDKWAKIQR